MKFLKILHQLKFRKARLHTWLIRGDFAHIGKQSLIFTPFWSNDTGGVCIGDNCMVREGGWIETVSRYDSHEYAPHLDIGDGTYIGRNAHIIACDRVSIGSNVVIADGVYISDNLHGFEEINRPVTLQPLVLPGTVVIEDEVWLGERVCVLPNVTIGRHSVVGSNSVVTKSIPPYCVAVGSPARVIKRYNFESGQWEPA